MIHRIFCAIPNIHVTSDHGWYPILTTEYQSQAYDSFILWYDREYICDNCDNIHFHGVNKTKNIHDESIYLSEFDNYLFFIFCKFIVSYFYIIIILRVIYIFKLRTFYTFIVNRKYFCIFKRRQLAQYKCKAAMNPRLVRTIWEAV